MSKYSQRTSPLPANHPVKQLVGLARQIALPHEYEPERFPSFPALERTAKLSFNQPSSFDVPANTTRKLALFRQAAYPLWMERTITGAHGYLTTYNTLGPPAVGAGIGYVGIDTSVVAKELCNWSNTPVSATTRTLGVLGLPADPTVYQYPLVAYDYATGQQPFTYIPAGSYSAVMINTTAVYEDWNGIMSFEQWDKPGETHTFDVPTGTITAATGGSVNGQGVSEFLNGGWFRPVGVIVAEVHSPDVVPDQFFIHIAVSVGPLAYAPSTLTAGNLTFNSGTSTAFIPVAPPAEFKNSKLPWQSTRVTASAVLATNVTTVLNKGGTVLAGRVAPETTNPWQVTSSTINLLHPAEKAFLPFETGLYTYCPPSTDLAHFWDYTLGNVVTTNSVGPDFGKVPVFRLDNDSLVNFAFFTSPSNIESIAVNMDWHIEFRTSSALFDVGMSTMTLETLHQAQIVLASVGFFFENFDHKAILNAVIAGAKKYGPAVASVFSPIAGQFADLILSKIPEPGMTTTSIAVKPSQALTAPKRRRKKNKKPAVPEQQVDQKAKKASGLDMYLASRKGKQ